MIKNFYEKYWDENNKWSPSSGGPQAIESNLFNRYLKPGLTCLDYGSGDGLRYGHLLSSNFQITYIGRDISRQAVDRGSSTGLNIGLIDDAGSTGLKSESVDIAFCFEVFEHLLEPTNSLAEIKRCLKGEGLLIASVPNAGIWWNRLDFLLTGTLIPGGSPLTGRKSPWADPHIRFFSYRTFRNFLRDQGFKHIKFIPERFSLSSLPLVYRIPLLSKIANLASLPLFWISYILPSLFSGRIYAIAMKK